MMHTARILGLLALAGTLVPSVLFLFHAIGEGTMKMVMLVSTVVWFATAPFWMKGGDH